MTCFIGLDLGTSHIKAVLLDGDAGQIRAVAARPTPVQNPRPGWSEHGGEEFWRACRDTLREIAPALEGQKLGGVGVASMAEAGLPLDRRGQPLAPIIAWYDPRSDPQARWIEQQVGTADLYAITGQRVSPSFSATKILWLKENEPAAYRQTAHWLPVSSYILYRLCNTCATSDTIAARTLLYDVKDRAWSERLLSAFGLEGAMLPRVLHGSETAGEISPHAAEETGLPKGAPVFPGGHDHLCAAFASGAHRAGQVVDSSGTAQALVLLIPGFLNEPRAAEEGYACYPYVLPGIFALKGGLKAAGGAIDWLAQALTPPGEAPDLAALERSAREGVGRRAGPLWLPHLIGSGSPEADRYSRAALFGVKIEHQRGDLFRGLLESLACWLRHNIETMQTLAKFQFKGGSFSPAEITLTGGVTRLSLLTELKANVLNRAVSVPDVPESAACGAALLAGLGSCEWASAQEAIASLDYPREIHRPDATLAQWYERMYTEIYLQLYQQAKAIHAAMQAIENGP